MLIPPQNFLIGILFQPNAKKKKDCRTYWKEVSEWELFHPNHMRPAGFIRVVARGLTIISSDTRDYMRNRTARLAQHEKNVTPRVT